jgi:hypothetical protein
MPSTQAMIGYGSVFEMADEATPTVFAALGEVFNIDPGDDEEGEVQATHYFSDDKTHEYIPGLTTPGTVSVEGNYIPGSATDLAIIGARGKKNIGRITLPNGVRKTFPVVRRGYVTALPLEDRMTFTATFRKAGATTTDTATVPVFGVSPSISGDGLDEGDVLKANPGVVAPFATFTYQWQRDGVDIPGATSQTYALAAADKGKDLTVDVTATNTGGTATASSLPIAIPEGD